MNWFEVYYVTHNGASYSYYDIYAHNGQINLDTRSETNIIRNFRIDEEGFRLQGNHNVTLNIDDLVSSYTLKLPSKEEGTYTLATTDDIGGGSSSVTLQELINSSNSVFPSPTLQIDGFSVQNEIIGDLYGGNSSAGLQVLNFGSEDIYRRYAGSSLYSTLPTIFGVISSSLRSYLGGTINITENSSGNSKSHNDLITTSTFAGMRSGVFAFSKGGYYIGTINAIEIDSTSVYLAKYTYDDSSVSTPVGSDGAFIKTRIYNDNVTDNRDLFIIDASGDIPMVGYIAPESATSIGIKGEVRITSTFIYTCINTNTWVRSTAATW